MTNTKQKGNLKLLLVCSQCGKVEKFQAVSAIVFGDNGIVYLRGLRNFSLEFWDNFAAQLSGMVRHECDKSVPQTGCDH